MWGTDVAHCFNGLGLGFVEVADMVAAGVFRRATALEARKSNGLAASRLANLLSEVLFGAISSDVVTGGKPLDPTVCCPHCMQTGQT